MCFRRLLIGVVALAGPSVLTESAWAGQIRSVNDPMRDVRQTNQARKRMADDADLAGHNIGVVVRDRVATLWGPVASAEIAFRAELCLRTMIELAEVRNELYVSDIIESIRRPLRIDNPPLFVPDRSPPNLPQTPQIIIGAPGVLMGQDTTQVKQPASRPTSSPSPKAKGPPVEIKVLSPEAFPKLGSPQAEPDVAVNADQRLMVDVRTVLQSKEAYREVLFAVKSGRVYLKCLGDETDILHDAARAIARLPNVAGVVIVEKSSPR